MAYYKGNFENLYDPPVTLTYEKSKTVTADEKATYEYMDGLDINASGQIFTRFATFLECNSTESKRNIKANNCTFNFVGIQAGAATINLQGHFANLALSATEKTEIARKYTLFGAFFFNPSRIKLLSHLEDKHDNKYTQHVLLLKSGYWKTVRKLSGKRVQFFGITFKGF